ncbi:MAG: FtsQ-type POTRA domain-containing protein [Acidobacteriia bacterium]|jgi:cell division protein FtsQ|nr:FtsQ-type POTRA domain-containing protein [Terriglobia bacterium]
MVDEQLYPSDAVLAPEREEPRYLRRQRPVEIRRRRFSREARRVYLRRTLLALAGVAATGAGYLGVEFLLHAPQMALASPAQVVVTGNRYVSRATILEKFYPDRYRSVLQVPLAERRAAVEAIPWVERATVRRVLPNRIEVELVERTPVAFLRLGPTLALVDAHGVILDPPVEGGADFRFPVVSGLHAGMVASERQRRMQLYVQFLAQIEAVRAGASQYVSEVDLAEASNLKAVLVELPELGRGAGQSASVLVHFGDRDFARRFSLFLENIGQWRATAGHVEAVDLRFERQVVVNPEERP